jgi:hypothetical protein
VRLGVSLVAAVGFAVAAVAAVRSGLDGDRDGDGGGGGRGQAAHGDFPEPPAELAGAEYHEHVWSCVVDGEELDEEDVGTLSPADCEARHGEWAPGAVWMAHVWLIDNPDGVFAETNPALA